MNKPLDYEKRLPRGAGILISLVLSLVIFWIVWVVLE